MSDPARELSAALETAAVADLSGWGRLIGTGRDLLDLLHRLTTQDVRDLLPGAGRPAVLTTAKGRIVERLSIHHLGPRGVLVMTGPGTSERVLGHLRRYTFAEDTGLADVSSRTAAFALIGPRWREAASAVGLPIPEAYAVSPATLGGASVDAIATNGFDSEGLLVIGGSDDASAAAKALGDAASRVGGSPIGAVALEAWRILTERPLTGRELGEEYNPLEAGLTDAVSFTKGCYVGQEVVARLNTYDKVSRRIVRLALPAGAPAPAPGSRVVDGGRVLGTVTSAVVPPGRDAAAALAYVKIRELPSGSTSLAIEGSDGSVPAAIVTDRAAS